MERIFLRKATLEDAELLFSWANDMDVRRNAFQQQDIMWEEHAAWMHKKLGDENCHIYIARIDMTHVSDELEGAERIHIFDSPPTVASERPIGQVRLDVKDGRAEIDYSIDVQYRGKGYGTVMLNQVMQLPGLGVRTFVAKVKPGNLASVRVFEKCGFIKRLECEDYIELEAPYKNGTATRERIVICTQKSWNIQYAEQMKEQYRDRYDVIVMTKKEQLTPEILQDIKPRYLFFPHWSYLIPESVYGPYTCVVFHMTDLPFGRGGSPLQNLIVRGYTRTKLSAIRVDAGLDTGDIYGKEELELDGTADDILRRASGLIFTRMIPWIVEQNPKPVPQQGAPVTFRRRKPEEGKLLPEMDEKTIYDYIRMLDGEGYPNAYVEMGDYRIRFHGASYENGIVEAKVRFERKQ